MAVQMVPITYVLAAGFVGIFIAMIMFVMWQRDSCEEGRMFNKARKNGLPILSIENIANGHAWFVLGEKDEDDDPIFTIEGMKIDPSMCSGDAEPTRYSQGLNIWHYASSKALPISTISALAYKTMKEHRRDKKIFEVLDFLTDQELFTLLRQPRQNLKHDAMIFIDKYNPDAPFIPGEKARKMTEDEFIQILELMQDFYAMLPVETGWLCYYKAFKDLPYAHSSQDIQRIKYLFEQKAWQQWANRINMMQYVIMAIMILAALGAVVYLITLAVGK